MLFMEIFVQMNVVKEHFLIEIQIHVTSIVIQVVGVAHHQIIMKYALHVVQVQLFFYKIPEVCSLNFYN